MRKIIVFLFVFLFPFNIFANYNEINPKINKAYDRLYKKISSKNNADKGLIFLKGLQKKLVDFSNSSKVNYKNSKILNDLEKINNEKIFSLEWEKIENNAEKNFSKNQVFKKFENRIYDDKDFFSLENGVWYFYKIKKYIKFDKISLVSENDIKKAKLNYSKTVIFVKDGILFANDYEKFKLIEDNILYGVPNKMEFLRLFKKYVLRGGDIKNFSEKLLKIRKETEKITKNYFKNDDKILEIYKYILDNINYKNDYNIKDPDIFSGVKTFENKIGVCEGYIELFYMMLAFNNIDSTILTGDVMNMEDFLKVGHAWLKIEDYYYDVTFDDWNSLKGKIEKDFMYFRVPRDLFYTNRFDFGKTPNNLAKLNLKQRQDLVSHNLASLLEKYKNYDYNILNEISFRKKYNIDISKNLEISDLLKTKDKIYKTDLDSVIIDGKKKYFSDFVYFELENNNDFLEAFLIKINYNIKEYTIFEVNKDGEKSYIISKDYSF